jgi:stage II sporulation protein AA (anti-sigma F factor antagonist)
VPFAAAVSRRGAVAVCALSGQLDSRAAADLERQLTADLSQGPSCLLVDCADLEFVTSAGLRVLLLVGKRLDAAGGCLALCSLNASTRQVLDIAGFGAIFAIRRDREDALTWLEAEGKTTRAAHMARSLLRSDASPPRDPRTRGEHRDPRAASRVASRDTERSDLAAELLRPKRPEKP